MRPARPMRPRAALSNQGGDVEIWGDEQPAVALADALLASNGPAGRYTHGFHTYPARMHPGIAAEVIARFTQPGDRVLDPFCGSGTVLVEALIAGRLVAGVDLSPLALRIAEAHVARPNADQRARFIKALEKLGEASLERVQTRKKALAPLTPSERAFYDPHVLLELAGIREEILALKPGPVQRTLEVVLSSLLVKVSKQRADTSDETIEKRIRKGLTTEMFVRKGRELAERWAELDAAMPHDARPAKLALGDARALMSLVHGPFELILSSPPYGGTYDYHSHHVRRYPWLGLDARSLERDEIGARRRLSDARDGQAQWDDELLACLRSMHDVLAQRGCIVLLIGDAELSGRRIDAREQLERLAPRAKLRLIAAAAQMRPDFRGGPARREHLLLLA